MAELPARLPDESPKFLKRLFGVLIAIASIIGVVGYILEKTKPIGSEIYSICQGIYLCGPTPLKYMRPLASGYQKGNTIARAAAAQFDQYSKENLDWDICITNTRSHSKSGPFNTNVEYRMEGEFFGVPKWRSLFAVASDFFSGRTYTAPTCPKN